MLAERAPAKINLTLRVLGRRADGYHELESLVVFGGVSDRLALIPGPGLSLTVEGPTSDQSGALADNLVVRAARMLAERCPGLTLGAFHLVKRLPVAAGIGGGSSDAAAALRLLVRANGLAPDDDRVIAAACATGADVPVCLAASARLMAGLGEQLSPRLSLPRVFAVLVNPRVHVPTAAVFRALAAPPLGAEPRGPVAAAQPFMAAADAATLVAAVAAVGNDLEAPAGGLCPEIAEAIALLRADQACRLARMSGSGATVFGLYDDCRTAGLAARAIRAVQPGWWVRPTVLR